MCEFSRQLPGPVAETLARARRPIAESGGSLEGDERRRVIRIPTPVGEIAGDYVVMGSTIAFTITQKPFFVPCAAIESRVDRFLVG